LARGAIFSAPRLKILMPGAANQRLPLQDPNPALHADLAHPGEGIQTPKPAHIGSL
jgi:hypothetical protein